jgi:hypothetical protein
MCLAKKYLQAIGHSIFLTLLRCYTVFMMHLFTNMHPDAVFEQHFTFSQMTKAAEQKRSLV